MSNTYIELLATEVINFNDTFDRSIIDFSAR